ncbi:CBS domain-containing protein [Desulfofustis limnaeus]|jgi:CBS domain-containing protein|uniref:Membrane protein n=1 Tax=Desulfofustis limnaeus TaxID=2740163 RepID=A0ABN6M2N0_9BACT|nr:CBS domain-containing protein [Desulfofustis limnaeus]MDX9894499.1 CBS domain-containing protein [Desulfofustis sp.]BDD87131.1 membrane protein [Desulfofustis limnaeus]
MNKAQDIMTSDVICVRTDTTIRDVARIFTENNISGVPVIDENGDLLGIVTESDLIFQNKRFRVPPVITILDSFFFLNSPEKMDKELRKIAGATVADVYSTPAISIRPDTPLDEIATIMTEKKIHTLPVVGENGAMVGIVGKKDIIKTIL